MSPRLTACHASDPNLAGQLPSVSGGVSYTRAVSFDEDPEFQEAPCVWHRSPLQTAIGSQKPQGFETSCDGRRPETADTRPPRLRSSSFMPRTLDEPGLAQAEIVNEG
jgi:hypothetical protein